MNAATSITYCHDVKASSMGSGASEHDIGANSRPTPNTHSPICTKSCWHLGVSLHDAKPPVTHIRLKHTQIASHKNHITQKSHHIKIASHNHHITNKSHHT